ncbi:MAG: hypothetical protein ACRDH7_11200 [Actinomycetota bacterium]
MNRKDLPTTSLRRLVYSTRAVVSVHPSLFLPFARRKYGRAVNDRVVETDTELVIEGFQRSGNTFAAVAFEMAQQRRVKTAHHMHAAAQIVAAARMGIPTLVLIRDPEACVLSQMVREPGIAAGQALANWVRFYEHVIPCRDRVVMAGFEQVTTDFGAVIREVNERFGTPFAEFEHTDANVEHCFELIELGNRARYGALREPMIARPSVERNALKDAIRRQYGSERLARLRSRATAVHRALVPSQSVS